MTPLLPALVAGAGVLAALAWIWSAVEGLVYRRRMRFLADQSASAPADGWPSLAVVVAARDEAEHVEAAMRSLLAEDYPDLRVVAVDDRSTDGTGAILDRLAEEDRRLRPIHIGRLPPGWLGKNHALHVGLAATDAEWVLFTDGDVRFTGTALRKAVRHAVERQLDHVAVLADLPMESAGEKLFIAIFAPIFFWRAPPWRVQNPRNPAFIGVGAFNLVRAATLRALGGFERIALSVDDDIRLGQMMKWSGGRADLLLGSGAVWVRWHVGLGGLIRGLEKNFFPGLEFRISLAVLFPAFILWLFAAPHAGLLAGPWWTRAICAAGVSCIAAMFLSMGPRGRVEWYYALALPLSAVLLNVAVLRSAWTTLRQGGVRWREHLYPLPELKAHVRERRAWMRARWRETRTAARAGGLDAEPGSGQNR